MDMAGAKQRIHELGMAARRYNETQGGLLPRGAWDRKAPTTRGRPYPPFERISWMAELLPFLQPEAEYSAISQSLNRDKSWHDPDNLRYARVIIPQFLDPQNDESTWWVHYPGTNQGVAATHYVGIAGVGLDAADYASGDPNTGVFGNDRQTRLQDIRDGASNTILMAEVPPTYKRPWIAGGGATMAGVPEKDSVKPFVCKTYDGRRGTMVIMVDGSVRFVSEKISDEVFKAMCTTNGGEALLLTRDAPLVPEPQDEIKPDPNAKVPEKPALILVPPAAPPSTITPAQPAPTTPPQADPTPPQPPPAPPK
jgi:hypothetical protein